MRKARIIVPVSFAMLMLGVWGGTQLTALASARQATNLHATRGSSSAEKPVTSSLKGASATYFESEIDSDTALNGNTPVGKALSVKCSGPAKCTLELDEDIQFCYGDSGDAYAVEASVDGKFLSASPFSGQFAGEPCDTTHWAWQVKNLAPGTHAVQFYGSDVDNKASAQDFMFTVRVFNQ